ncbi:MAG: hypothetical protein HKL86_05660 [Acidimicrobiaceae bacterium]|nr:hypothetical protein [Acidimicrobiaceae bacterium]
MSTPRAVRIITEVAAVDRAFDYRLSATSERAQLGDRVRVDFNHRSVRGWVMGEVEATPDLKEVTKWLGYGPPSSLLALLEWASDRWYGPVSRFLVAASTRRLVATLPEPPERKDVGSDANFEEPVLRAGIVQVAPTTDPMSIIVSAYEATLERAGSLLVLVPTESWASRLRARLERRGYSVAAGEAEWDRMRSGWPVVVGARGAALAPLSRLCGAVIIDADDESYVSHATPTWNAFTMLQERCRRDDAPLWATSMLPSAKMVGLAAFQRLPDLEHGWPSVDFVDRRLSDPHDGVLSRESLEAAHEALATDEAVAVVVVLQRLGSGRLFACSRCGELARCASCGQGEREVGTLIACDQAHEPRQKYCRHCGATSLKAVRAGVATLARDVSAQLSRGVSELTAASPLDAPLERVVVGTEAVWQRVRRCALVIFVDFDQYLLAPRASARREAIMAVGKAGRLVGARSQGRGAVMVQTRRGNDPVVESLRSGNFDSIIDDEVETARLLGLAPFGAQATVSGPGARAFVEQLSARDLVVHQSGDVFTLNAPDVVTLSRSLSDVRRPSQRVRVAVE